MSQFKSRSFCYTLNNPVDEEVTYQAIPCAYHVYGRETGESGTPHLQGLIQFPNPRSFSSIRKLLGRAHVEVCKDLQASITYCKKDGDFWESGILPIGKVGKKCSFAERASKNKRLLEMSLADLVSTGEISLSQVPILKKARLILAQDGEALQTEDVRGVWYYGPPGTGKSHKARTEFPNAFIKAQNKWFDGYQGEDTIILDDLDCKELGHYVKIWTDKWKCSGEVKGWTVALKHARFIVTSNYHPSDLWEGVMLEAITRRFTITHFDKINKIN